MQRRQAFTLVELMVVIAIIAILMGLTLVGIRSVYASALKTDELSRIRQLGNAWLMYSQSHRDSIVAGWMDHTAQARRDLHQVYPDLSEVPPAPDWDTSRSNVAGYWTWQLLPYLDYSWPTIRGHLPEDQQLIEDFQEDGLDVALTPGFGYNGWYLGGQWARWDPHFPDASLRFSNVELSDGSMDNLVITSLPSIQRSTEVIAFCSSFASDGPMSEPIVPNSLPGSWLVEPRLLAGEARWELDAQGDLVVLEATNAPLARYTSQPACWFPDGHTEGLSYEELADQRRWIDDARSIGDVDARDFTHEDDY
jgi:prepilin-type N-terminal cleavage/methylation domain-containing protein